MVEQKIKVTPLIVKDIQYEVGPCALVPHEFGATLKITINPECEGIIKVNRETKEVESKTKRLAINQADPDELSFEIKGCPMPIKWSTNIEPYSTSLTVGDVTVKGRVEGERLIFKLVK